MFKQFGNIASLIKQAQSMGSQMPAVAEELKTKRVTGSAGAGMVKVTADGLGTILSVEFDQLLRDKGDLEMIQDLLPAAVNDAIEKSKALHVEAMQEVTGGLAFPAGLDDMLKQMTGGDEPESPAGNHPGDAESRDS